MKRQKLTPELRALLDNVTKTATAKELFIAASWDIFNRKKSNKLIECLKAGMNWMSAYRAAKELD